MYKLFTNNQDNVTVVMRVADKMFIPFDPQNSDYIAYLKWIEEGNVPTPADTPA
jgi:hypothetical protein